MVESASPSGTSPLPLDTPSVLRTFVIADVRGYSRFTQEHGDEAAAQLVAVFASITRRIVASRGGQVIELRGDEALCVFSSARQALRAAVDLQAAYAQAENNDPSLPLPVGIGIDAGEAVAFEGGYRGEALNLAARLCNLAGSGEILATEGVVYLGRQVQGVSYVERGLVPLKGFVAPVRVIRVLGKETRGEGEAAGEIPPAPGVNPQPETAMPIGGFLGALPSGVLIGREKEWDRIMVSLHAVMHGGGRLVLLSGEPGIGKTRIAQEITLKARHWGFLVATGRCYEQNQSVPFYPFLEALATFYHACSSPLRLDLAMRYPQLQRLLPDQLTLTPPAQTSGGPLDQEDQYLLFRAVAGLIQSLAVSMPVALLLDDLHWADDSSLKLLQHLARYTRSHRVLLAGTYRDVEINRQHPLEGALLDLGREQLVDDVEIRRLGPEGTAGLIREIIGDNDDLSDLAEAIHRQTDGNAFFVQEVLRSLIEQGDVYRRDGRWEWRNIEDLEVPKSIRSVIGQRLSRLEDQAQEILREASILGQSFAFNDLMALGQLAPLPPTLEAQHSNGWTEDEIDDAVERAMGLGILRQIDGEHYAFQHALIQQALYAELSSRRKKRLHMAAGHAIARLPQPSRDRRAAEIARHLLEGDHPRLALPFTLIAGDRAEEVFAHGEAERYYTTALELARDVGEVDREIESLEKLAGVIALGARYDLALELFEQAARLLHAASRDDEEACVVAKMGHVYFLRDTPDEGIARLEPLVERLEHRMHNEPPTHALAALWVALARLYSDTARQDDMLRVVDRAVEISRTIAHEPEGARLLLGAEVTRSIALRRLGRHEESAQLQEELIRRAEAADDMDNLARALGTAGAYYSYRGDFDKDRLYRERALLIAEQRGDRGQTVMWLMSLSTNAYLMGDWARAHAYIDRAEATISSLSHSRISIWPTAARGWLALREGNLDLAATLGTQALKLAEEFGDVTWCRLLQRLLAERDMLLDDPEGARTRLLPLRDTAGWKRDVGFLRSLASAMLALGETTEATELTTQSLKQARIQNNQPELAETLIVHAGALLAIGEVQEAEGLIQDAVSMTRLMHFPFGEAQALTVYAELLAQRGNVEAARQHLDRALAILSTLGAGSYIRRIERAVSRLSPQ